MSKKTIAPEKAPIELIERVREIKRMKAEHRLGMRKIYETHNEVFGLNDTPQSCHSCLTFRVSKLMPWLDKAEAALIANPGAVADNTKVEDTVDNVMLKKFLDRVGINLGTTPGAELAALRIVLMPDYPVPFETGELDAVILRVMELESQGTTPATAELPVATATAPAKKVAAAKEVPAKKVAAAKEVPAKKVATPKASPLETQGDDSQYEDATSPGYIAPALGVTRYPMGEGVLPFDFTPSEADATKGTIKNADGTSVKAGTYFTADGIEIAVQPGSKATIKENLG